MTVPTGLMQAWRAFEPISGLGARQDLPDFNLALTKLAASGDWNHSGASDAC
jgi:hypothetical protein